MRPSLCALVLALLFCGCGGDQHDDAVTLRFWHSFVSSTRPALDALIEQFEEEHPGIRIQAQYVPTGDGLVRKLVSSIQSGTAPDLSWVHADFLGNLVQSDAIYPMSTFLDGENGLTDDELADFFPATLQAARWRDTLYALPMEATLLALIYNKDHFREAGIDPDRPPATWADLREYSRRLTKDTDGNGRIDRFGFYVPVFPASGPLSVWMVLQWSPYIWGAGGALINHEQTRVLYDSDAGVRALTFWKDLFLDMDSPALSMTHDAHFTAGHVSIIMDGPWDLPRFRELEHIDWGIAPLPAGPDEQVTYLAGEHLAIFRQTKHADEAWTFVKWVTQPEVQAFFSKESGYLPVRQSTLDLPSYRDHLEDDWALRAFVDQMSLGRARRPIDLYQVEINRHIAEAIESALIGGEEPAAALRASAAKSNALLRK